MDNLEIRLKRIDKQQSFTMGRISIDGVDICDSIEDKDRGLSDLMTERQIHERKVYGRTAIPTGRYKVILAQSFKFSSREWAREFGGLIPRLENVKGFDGILIHPLNTAEESLGCIGPGFAEKPGRVGRSRDAYRQIMAHLIPAHESGRPIYITIE